MYNFPDDPSVGEKANGLEWDGSKWIAVWPKLDSSNFVLKDDTEEQIVAGPLTAESFKGNGEEITDIITDQLADVNSENAVRDDLLIFNGTLWEATSFAFIETKLQFNGGIDVTDSSEYPDAIDDGDLYVANEDGIVAAEWVGIAGTSITAGNFVGWAETKGRWYLLGDLASSAVTAVGAGTGIDVDDAVAAVPVVSIDRAEVDTWYADLGEFNDLKLDVETNTENIANNKIDIDLNADDIADNKLEIENNANNIANNKLEIEANANNINEIEVNIGNIDLGDLEANVNALDADAVKKSVATVQAMVGDLKAKSFEGAGSKLSGITTDQLADVNSAGAKKDEFLIYNGSSWIAEGFHIDTELTYQGAIDLTAAMTITPANGHLYINNTAGAVHSSWVGISGQTVREGNVVGYADSKSRWFLMGDIASASVINVEAGTGIDVDDSKAAEPVVSIDRTEVDTWYEPKFNKLSAFNKNFGTTAGTVSEGNHLHSQYLTGFTETDPTVPAHVKSISTADIAKWNTPAPAAPVSSVNAKTGAVVLTHTDVGAQVAGSYAASNHNHSGVYAPESHTHSQYLTSFTETDPTVPAHVKSISTSDIAKWNTPGAAPVSSVNSKTGAVVLAHGDVGAAAASHTHSQYLTSFTESDPTVPAHVKSISTSDIAKWNTPGSAPVSSVNGKTGAVVLAHGDVGAAAASHTHAYAPTNHTHSEYAAKSHTHSEYSPTSHNHSGVYAPASHTHSYVPLSGNSTIAGTLTATDFTITSDERLKSDVKTLDPLKVLSMRGVSYTLKETGESSSGVIAQELQEVAPELVVTDHHGYLSVAYPKLVGYLIEAIKDQKEDIIELRQAIEDMC